MFKFCFVVVPAQIMEQEENEELVEREAESPTCTTDLALMALCMCNAVDAIEVLAFSSILTGYINPHTATRLDEDAPLSALLTASVFIGMLIGGLVAGLLGDRLGRKPVLMCCMLVNAACAMLSAATSLSVAWQQAYLLALFRFVGGLGVGGSVPCVFALVAELTTPLTNTRGKRVTLLATSWTLGSIFTSTLAWLVLDPVDNTQTWPRFFLLCSLPAWLSLIMTLAFVRETLEEEQIAPVEASDKVINKQRLISMSVVFFAANFGSYGPMTWMSDVFAEMGYSDPFLMALFSASSALGGNALAYLLMDRVARKRLLLTGMIGSAAAAISFQLAPLIASCLFSVSLTMSWTSLGVMSSEAFPVKTRTTQLGLAVSFGRLGSIAANSVNPLLLRLRLILPIAGITLLLGALVAWRCLEHAEEIQQEEEEPV